MKKLVNVRQTIMLLILSMFGLKVLLLPNLLTQEFGRDCYLYLFFMLILDFVVLIILLFVKNKYKNLSFYEIIEYFFGKVFAKIIMLVMAVFFFIKCCGVFQSNYVFLNENLYTTFNWYIFSVPILVVLTFVSLQGVNAVARTIEVFFPIILLGIIASTIVGVMRSDFSNLLPVLENGVDKIGNIFNYSFWFGDYLIFIVLFDNVKEEKRTNLKIILSILVSIFVITFFYVVFFATYNNNCICHTNAISDILQVLPSISDIGSFDWILILIWDVTLFLLFVLNTLGVFYCLRQTIFKKSQIFVAILISFGVFIANVLNHFDVYPAIYFVQHYYFYFSIAIQYGLPILIFFMALIKRRKKVEVSLEK